MNLSVMNRMTSVRRACAFPFTHTLTITSSVLGVLVPDQSEASELAEPEGSYYDAPWSVYSISDTGDSGDCLLQESTEHDSAPLETREIGIEGAKEDA
jgi:hypothetical protein